MKLKIKIILLVLCVANQLFATLLIENCTFTDSSKGPIIESLSDVLLINCVSSGNQAEGFDFIATNSILMCSSFAHANQGAGIHFDASCFAIDVFDTISEQNTGGNFNDDTSSAFQVSNKIIQSKVCEIEVDLASDTDAILSAIDEIDFNVVVSVTLTGEAVSGCDYLITQSQIPYIANRPGVHCLVENIQGGFVGTAAITITSSCVTLDMMDRFIDGANTSQVGINVNGANDVIIKDGTIKNTTSNGIFIGSGASGKERITVNNVHIANTTSSAGVAISSGANIIFEGCNIYNCAGEGMQIFGTAADLVIRACIASQNVSDGFWVSSSSVNNCIFENTIAENNGADGFNISGSNCQITNCTSASNTSAGVRNTGTGLIFCNNVIYNNGTELIGIGDNCSACDFVIRQGDIPLTIDMPGVWCVAEDIDGGFAAASAITITTSCVTLDLQGHCIDGQGTGVSGVNVTVSHNDVVIQNGSIINMTTRGISLDGDRLHVQDIQIVGIAGVSAGILVSGSDTTIENCQINQYSSRGILVTGDRFVVKNCLVSNGGETPYQINGSNGCISDSKAISNTANGFDIRGDNVLIQGCYSADNPAGFDISGDNCQLRDSSAINNTVGIDASGAVGLMVCNNIVNNNGTNLINTIDGDLCKMGCDFIIQQSDLPYTITIAGNYCLAESVMITSTGITINSDNVTLDLRDKIMEGSSTGDGIIVLSVDHIIIKNGTVVGFNNGITIANGASFVAVENCEVFSSNVGVSILGNTSTIENCIVSDNAVHGIIITTAQNIVKNCQVADTASGDGFRILGDNNILDTCQATNCSRGFFVVTGVVDNILKNCQAISNGLSGFQIAGTGSTLDSCQAINNGEAGFLVFENDNVISNSISNSNGLDGFSCDQVTRLVVKNNIAESNTLRGFDFTDAAAVVVKDNIAEGNGSDGFRADSDSNHILFDSNSSGHNTGYGFLVEGVEAQATFVAGAPLDTTWNIGAGPSLGGDPLNDRFYRFTNNVSADDALGSFFMSGTIYDILTGDSAAFTTRIFPTIGVINTTQGNVYVDPKPTAGTVQSVGLPSGRLLNVVGGNMEMRRINP